MFHDLDATIGALVESELSLKNVSISFATPDDQFPPSSVSPPAIVFFLYGMRENSDLRTSQWETERLPTGTVTRKRPPVRVDCSYLITAWPGPGVPSPAQDEHRLLGEVTKVLLRHPTIPDSYLRGELVGQEPPLRARFLADSQLHTLGEFWQAMGGKPRATLHYAVTVSLDVFEPVEVGPEVKRSVISITQNVGRG